MLCHGESLEFQKERYAFERGEEKKRTKLLPSPKAYGGGECINKKPEIYKRKKSYRKQLAEVMTKMYKGKNRKHLSGKVKKKQQQKGQL